jgi:hypothetical protein
MGRLGGTVGWERKKEMKKVFCWIYFCKRFSLLFPCFNCKLRGKLKLMMRRRRRRIHREGGWEESREEQQVILMKIGELRFCERFLLAFSPSMPSPHKSDLIKKLLVPFLSFSLMPARRISREWPGEGNWGKTKMWVNGERGGLLSELHLNLDWSWMQQKSVSWD